MKKLLALLLMLTLLAPLVALGEAAYGHTLLDIPWNANDSAILTLLKDTYGIEFDELENYFEDGDGTIISKGVAPEQGMQFLGVPVTDIALYFSETEENETFVLDALEFLVLGLPESSALNAADIGLPALITEYGSAMNEKYGPPQGATIRVFGRGADGSETFLAPMKNGLLDIEQTTQVCVEEENKLYFAINYDNLALNGTLEPISGVVQLTSIYVSGCPHAEVPASAYSDGTIPPYEGPVRH